MKNRKSNAIHLLIIFIGIILLICGKQNSADALSLEDAMRPDVKIMSTYEDVNGNTIRGKLEHYNTGNQRATNAKKNV